MRSGKVHLRRPTYHRPKRWESDVEMTYCGMVIQDHPIRPRVETAKELSDVTCSRCLAIRARAESKW